MKEVFDRIYRDNLWNGTESMSGPGSSVEATHPLLEALDGILSDKEIESVLDVGCGDGNWMPQLPGYIGLDISGEAIERSQTRHPGRAYILDTGEPFPTCDLVIMRQVMQHLSLADGLKLLARVRESGARWLLATSYRMGANRDIVSGDGYHINLEQAPFSLGEPDRWIPDGVGSWALDCRLGLWQI